MKTVAGITTNLRFNNIHGPSINRPMVTSPGVDIMNEFIIY
jgi:hypothetical protein